MTPPSWYSAVWPSRVRQVWRPWQQFIDRFLADHVGEDKAHILRSIFDYPRRKIVGVDSVVGPSFERNFVDCAHRWARGERYIPTQPENWGLADEEIEQRTLCRAGWEAAS